MFIDDSTGTIGSAAINEINALASPFDVKVVVASTASRAALDAQVSTMVNSGNTLAIGVDPVHHYTFTHFGVGTGIPRDRYQDVARAGNGDFHAGRWADGIKTIVASATAARQESRASSATVIVQSHATTVERPVPIWPFLIGGLALLFGFFLIWRWTRRRSDEASKTLDDFRSEADQLRARNIEEQGWHDKMAASVSAESSVPLPIPSRTPPPLPAPPMASRAPSYAPIVQPVIVQQSRDDGFLTGVLIGESLADRRSFAPRERTPEPVRHGSSSSSDSSSSSWDSGGSFDSGSGGGDFGGGFDSGGGGGDF